MYKQNSAQDTYISAEPYEPRSSSTFSTRLPSTVSMVHVPPAGGTSLDELSSDVVEHCSDFLDVRDVVSLAMTCKSLRTAAYSDYIWSRLYKERWPNQQLPLGGSEIRDSYLNNITALQQMNFEDPKSIVFSTYYHKIKNHIVMDSSNIWASEGSDVDWYGRNSSSGIITLDKRLNSHGSRITNMRLIPISDTWLFRNETKSSRNVLITSSEDRTVRLWFRGKSQRCFKGHKGPVTALADKLLGSDESKLLASGGEDSSVKIWSLGSNHKNHSLATFHGHEKPLSFLSVAWHRPSLLISISKDARLRAWDTSAYSSSPCVGSTSISDMNPVGFKCHDTICYVATRSFITGIDLRTMRKAFAVPVQDSEIFSFEILPSKFNICAGAEDKALLWDMRKLTKKANPIKELESYGRVTLLHMDPYKIITAGPDDYDVKIWDPANGNLVNTLNCHVRDGNRDLSGVYGVAVDGCRIATSSFSNGLGELMYRDFSNCSKLACLSENEVGSSKFWDIYSYY